MTALRLNDLTQAELLAELEKSTRNLAERGCPYCGNPFRPKRHWQKFCSKACRAAYHTEFSTMEIERLQAAIAARDRLIDELREELAKTSQDLIVKRENEG